MNTLTYGVTTLVLPADLQWVDEFAWRAVEQRTAYTITGALVVEAYAKQAGRPVTLRADAESAWVDRATLNTLRTWADLPAQTFSLVLRGEAAITVVFDQASGPIEATPVIDYTDPDDTDDYIATLRFLKV